MPFSPRVSRPESGATVANCRRCCLLYTSDQGLKPVYAPVLPPAWKSITIKNAKPDGQSYDFVVSRDEAGKVQLERRPAAL